MSNEPKTDLQTEGRPNEGSPVPIWIFALTLLFVFFGAWYFDRHSGWFDARVYTPYQTAEQLQAYQPVSGAAAMMMEGQRTYNSICAACHGDNGQGKPGQAPPLAGSEWVNAPGFKRVAAIPQVGLSGPIHVAGQEWNLQMAAMGAALSDADLAAVLTYVRGSWGNKASDVTAEDIKAIRAGLPNHPIMGEAGLKAMPE